MGGFESRDKFHPPTFEFEEELGEKELFERAMEGVRPLPAQPRLIRPAARPSKLEPVNPSDLMEEAMEGVKEFEWPFAPGYAEGGDLQWNRRLLRRLRNGRFTVQAELDLHGFGQRGAVRELHQFLEECVGRDLTCVRIIHGLGHHSPNQISVLKKRLPEWLGWRQNAQFVAAFTSAPGVDGGGGALYVLLRKKSKRQGRSQSG